MSLGEIKDKTKIAVTGLEAIHKEALDRFASVESRERDQRKLAIEDMRFAQAEDGQWEEFAARQRRDRPRYTVNKVAPAIDTVVGDQRQNEISIRVRPAAGGAKKDVAETINGLIRNLESLSSARNSYDNGFFEALNGGYGGWRVVTQFSDDDSFEQDILIKPINSAASSLWFDPGAKEYDKRDAMWAFLTTDMEKNEFEARYPDAITTDFEQKRFSSGSCLTWFGDGVVRVAEYWRKVPITRTLLLLTDGRVLDEAKAESIIDELAAQGVTVQKERKVKTFKVERYLMNGAEILKGPEEWAGKFIPLIPTFGKVTHIEGEELVRGLVRFAKDSARIYNYSVSTIVETAALAPKDPYWMTPTQAKGHEGKLRSMNIDNAPVQFYNADPKAPGPPSRTGAPQVQQALIGISQQATLDINATLGVTAGSAQPQRGTELDTRSGRAIIAQDTRQDTSTFVFFDNLIKSIEYTGMVLVDLLPKIYDTKRQVRIMQQDGGTELVTINETIIDQQSLEPVTVNDMTLGKYDSIVDTGPAFQSKRVEAKDQLIALSENPLYAPLIADLLAKNMDIPGAEELHQRLRKQMIQQGVVEPTDEEVQELGLGQPAQPSPQEQLALAEQQARVKLFNSQAEDLSANAQLRLSNAELNRSKIEKTLSEADKTDIDANKSAVEAAGKNLDNIKKQVELGIPLTEQEHDMRIGQNDIVELSQDDISPGGTSEQQTGTISPLVQEALQQRQPIDNGGELLS